MLRLFRGRKILMPDLPPQIVPGKQVLLMIGIGVFCATLAILALVFVLVDM